MNRPHAHVANELEAAIKEKLPEGCGFVLVLFDPYGRPATDGGTRALRYEFRSDIPELKVKLPADVAALKDPAIKGLVFVLRNFLGVIMGGPERLEEPVLTRGSE